MGLHRRVCHPPLHSSNPGTDSSPDYKEISSFSDQPDVITYVATVQPKPGVFIDKISPEPMTVDPIDGLLPILRHHQWSGSSDAHISALFSEENNHPTPTCRSHEPKRPKIQVSTTSVAGSSPSIGRRERRAHRNAEAAALAILHTVTSTRLLDVIRPRATNIKRCLPCLP